MEMKKTNTLHLKIIHHLGRAYQKSYNTFIDNAENLGIFRPM